MRDPTAELVTCGHDDAWNVQLLETLGRHTRLVDHLSIHRYWNRSGHATEFDDDQYYALLAEALEVTPFHKMLYSSDAFGLAELHYLGAAGFRRDLARVTGEFVADGVWSAADADRVGRLIGSENARRVYRLPAG